MQKCISLILLKKKANYLVVNFENGFFEAEKDYSDGAYVILKSDKHTYAAPQTQSVVPIKTTLRRLMYFNKGAYASFHGQRLNPGFTRFIFWFEKAEKM